MIKKKTAQNQSCQIENDLSLKENQFGRELFGFVPRLVIDVMCLVPVAYIGLFLTLSVLVSQQHR